MWVERGMRLLCLLALLTVVAGLVLLALPDVDQGRELIQLDATRSLHVADLVAAAMMGAGALVIWLTVLVWQRRHIE